MESLLIVKTGTVQATNDKQQVEPMLKQLRTLPVELGKPATLVADMGYFTRPTSMPVANMPSPLSSP